MHVAEMVIDRREMTLSYKAKGHSGYGTRGNDPVCACASTVAKGLAVFVTAAYHAGWIGDATIVDAHDDEAEISCACDNEDTFGELVRGFLFAGTQMHNTELEYPQYIHFTMKMKV